VVVVVAALGALAAAGVAVEIGRAGMVAAVVEVVAALAAAAREEAAWVMTSTVDAAGECLEACPATWEDTVKAVGAATAVELLVEAAAQAVAGEGGGGQESRCFGRNKNRC
jgi:hypothetical protein